jgi:hypothetical protein
LEVFKKKFGVYPVAKFIAKKIDQASQKDKLEKEIEEYDLAKINSQLSKYEQIVIKKAQKIDGCKFIKKYPIQLFLPSAGSPRC